MAASQGRTGETRPVVIYPAQSIGHGRGQDKTPPFLTSAWKVNRCRLLPARQFRLGHWQLTSCLEKCGHRHPKPVVVVEVVVRVVPVAGGAAVMGFAPNISRYKGLDVATYFVEV